MSVGTSSSNSSLTMSFTFSPSRLASFCRRQLVFTLHCIVSQNQTFQSPCDVVDVLIYRKQALLVASAHIAGDATLATSTQSRCPSTIGVEVLNRQHATSSMITMRYVATELGSRWHRLHAVVAGCLGPHTRQLMPQHIQCLVSKAWLCVFAMCSTPSIPACPDAHTPQNSNLVLTAETRTREATEPSGEPETLWGRMKGKMGDRVQFGRPAEERKPKKQKCVPLRLHCPTSIMS